VRALAAIRVFSARPGEEISSRTGGFSELETPTRGNEMTTLVDAGTRNRLLMIAATMQKMLDNSWVRSDGEVEFKSAVIDLHDIQVTATEPVAVEAAPVMTVMTGEQVAAIKGEIVTAITGQIEASDVSIMAAIVDSQGEVITALMPTPAPTQAPAAA
jgi:hypothetical protein